MHAETAWRALTSHRFLWSRWPWTCAAYLVTGAAAGLAVLLLATALLAVGAALTIVLIGVPFLIALALLGLPVGVLERARMRLADTRRAPVPHRQPPHPGLASWARTRLAERGTWRALGYVALFATVLWPADLFVLVCALVVPGSLILAPLLLAASEDGEVRLVKLVLIGSPGAAWAVVPIGVAMLVLGLHLVALYATPRATVARVLLAGPGGDALTAVTRSRARLVDAFDAERRRIERDLHDGAQQRLVALGVTIGLARISDGEERDTLMAKAQGEAAAALAEIRELIHGIHPRVLTERGLAAALAEAVDHLAIPVSVTADLPRLPPAVETAAYFAACEALANVARHSGADDATLEAAVSRGRLRVEITDNGRGGADPSRGTGLTGLADRVAVVDGSLSLSSPPGGPTRVVVEIPCPPTGPPA
ncbi:histidine kinase [Actinorhabdospora filicis]|uniref:histidine kinase n=1 Tax=Actinorhabdospora filicis TaxID=1785913 RepID=A0A9W6W678_9ACTN|nr:sensor histidine kinase [Actinorhabdospora filicis]GLZ75289.1 histidine kinase [Actinorhabdospora filicis]